MAATSSKKFKCAKGNNITMGQNQQSRRIADLCNDDKPRERALRNGIRTLSDTELIAILLGGGIPGKSVIDLSRELYDGCNQSLSDMAKMSIAQMCKNFKGIGPAKAITIAAALELGNRLKDSKTTEAPQIRTSADAYNIIRVHLDNQPVEEFWIMILSRANRVITTQCISRGGTSATVVEPKIIIKAALDHLASGLILFHNHPSGNMTPSLQDDALTRKIKSAAELMEIKVLDHIIVGNNEFYSYADNQRI